MLEIADRRGVLALGEVAIGANVVNPALSPALAECLGQCHRAIGDRHPRSLVAGVDVVDLRGEALEQQRGVADRLDDLLGGAAFLEREVELLLTAIGVGQRQLQLDPHPLIGCGSKRCHRSLERRDGQVVAANRDLRVALDPQGLDPLGRRQVGPRDDGLDELERLAPVAGGVVVGEILQAGGRVGGGR